MSQTVIGKIKTIFPEQSFKNNFRKQQLVLTTNDKYPQSVIFDFVNDKISLLSGYMQGEEIKLSYNLRGNEYKGKPINSLQVWKIERLAGEVTANDQNPSRQQEAIDMPF